MPIPIYAKYDESQKEIEKLRERNISLSEALKTMLWIFDKSLEPGTMGRATCDEAHLALKRGQ